MNELQFFSKNLTQMIKKFFFYDVHHELSQNDILQNMTKKLHSSEI